MTATVTAPAAAREIYEAALARVRECRVPYEAFSELDRHKAWLDGRTLPKADIYASELREPRSAAEYFDRKICEWGGLLSDPVAPVLLAIADAAREGAEAAVRAVKAARKLDERAQWTAYRNLSRWRQGHEAARTGADRIVLAVEAEWARLRLADTDPDED